ncbi:MAG: phage virion morphogenesis protein [Alphaproteobacteria bacterium]|nr:phage virion morphogenesis protein [Alphaproteobacteria bacterium]
MIAVSIEGPTALGARFGAMPQTLARRLSQQVERLAGVLRERVERNLSGAVLRPHSGRLAGSVAVNVERAGLAVTATVGSDAPYAAIHEYGGVIPAREILPRSARAMAFAWRGKQRFYKRVRLPAVTMPERSFLRSALAETAPEIRTAVEQAAVEAMQS